MDASTQIELVRKARQAFRDAIAARDVERVLSLYGEDAFFYGENDDQGVRKKNGDGGIRDYYTNMFAGARHVSASFRTEPCKDSVVLLDESHIAYSGYYKISKLRRFSISEWHAKFVFVYVLPYPEMSNHSRTDKALSIKLHNSALSPKGVVHSVGHFSKIFQSTFVPRRAESNAEAQAKC